MSLRARQFPLSYLILAALVLLPTAAHATPAVAADETPAPTVTPPPGAPPATREELLRRERLRRAGATKPYRPSLVEREVLPFEKAERRSILSYDFKGLHPTIASISSGSRLAPGVRFWRPDMGGSGIDLHASAAYSLERYELYELAIGRIPHRGRELPPRSTKGDDVYELGYLSKTDHRRLILYPSLRYRHNPEERFFGLDTNSHVYDRTTYRLQDASYELVGGWQFGARVVATVRAGYLQVSLGPGTDPPATSDRFTDATAPGLAQQPDFYKVTSQVLLDYRDEPFNPHHGGMLSLSHSRFDDRGSADLFRFDRWAFDARGYAPLGSEQRVVAVRAYASVDDPADGARVPFYLQEVLGTSHTLRGFDTLRFRGERILSLQAEYRWEAAPAIELALFTDFGEATSSASRWRLSDLEHTYGFGVRLKSPRQTLVRFDVAKSAEGTRLFLRFSPSF